VKLEDFDSLEEGVELLRLRPLVSRGKDEWITGGGFLVVASDLDWLEAWGYIKDIEWSGSGFRGSVTFKVTKGGKEWLRELEMEDEG